MSELQKKYDAAIWCAHTLFQKGLVSGSTGNISFIEEDKLYISRSGSCFGRLCQEDFAMLDMQGSILQGTPSKEYPMHLALYQASEQTQAIIHTHSFYSTLFSCHKNVEDTIHELCSYTPYLRMMSEGYIPCVEYAKPGSEELFQYFREKVQVQANIYVLKNHGVFVSAPDMYRAYNLIEEFETSTHMYAKLSQYPKEDINFIE